MVRASALRVGVGTVLQSPIEKEGETTALRIGSELVNRVNIIGTVVTFQPGDNMLMLDDGSGTIAVQWFEGSQNVVVGDLVLVIGRVRDFNTRYVFPEVLKPVLDKRWLDVRRLELEQAPKVVTPAQPAPLAEADDDPEESALKLIHEMDRGEGADMDEVMERLGAAGEDIVKRLLMAGEIFEAKPGRLRLL